MHGQKKDIVDHCHEKLSKISMYPDAADIDKAARKLASKEKKKSPSFRRAIIKVVRVNCIPSVSHEYMYMYWHLFDQCLDHAKWKNAATQS